MKRPVGLAFALVLTGWLYVIPAVAQTIDFEDLTNLTPVTDQYSSLGITFTGATAATADLSLNQLEFPPRSGKNVVLDDGGPVTVTFESPVARFGAYFTYTTPLSLTFFDLSGQMVGDLTSGFACNLMASGDPGATPNELFSFDTAGGIGRVVITGDAAGWSFVMDDLSVETLQVPEPAPGWLIVLSLAAVSLFLCGARKRFAKGYVVVMIRRRGI